MDAADLRDKVDFGIITIREDEHAAVLARFPKLETVTGRQRYRIRSLPLPRGGRYTLAVLRCIDQSGAGAQNAARDLLEELDPAWLLVVGIAGGVPANEFTLGDVVVSSSITDFCVEAVLADGSRDYALRGGPLHPEAAKVAADIRAMVTDRELDGWNADDALGVPRPSMELAEDKFYGDDNWRKSTRKKLQQHFGDGARRVPLVVTGVLASSDRRIEDTEVLRVWLKMAREIQAIEMASAGVYKAAQGRSLPFLAVRGISDVIGFEPHPDWTAYACHTAAAFTRALLLTRPIAPRWTEVIEKVRDLLDAKVGKARLRKACAALKLYPTDNTQREALTAMVAKGLLKPQAAHMVGVRAVKRALSRMRPNLKHSEIKQLVDCILPYHWVPAEAAEQLAQVSRAPVSEVRMVSINAEKVPFTGEQYASRALQEWTLPDAIAVYPGQEATFECMVREIYAECLAAFTRMEARASKRTKTTKRIKAAKRTKIMMATEEELDEKLRAPERPVFVLVAKPVPDESVLRQLKNTFPAITFVLHTDHGEKLRVDGNMIPPLSPPLEKGREEKVYRQYHSMIIRSKAT